jgi:hypothetical protein
MARPKHTNWALFDEEWNFKGGVTTLEGVTPTDDGSNPKGYQEVKVKRFPQHYEHWDPKRGSWAQDRAAKAKEEAIVGILEKQATGELDLPQGRTQRWFYLLLQRLFPDTKIPADVMQEFFPFVDPDEPPKSLVRPAKARRRL